MMELINLTPHRINVLTRAGEYRVIEPSGTVARISSTTELVGEIDGIEIHRAAFGAPVDLPDPAPGVRYIVSGLVLDAVRRDDLLAPGELIRGEDGQPIGCRGFRTAAGG